MADDRSPLESEIRRLIGIAGPMPVADYMRLCLTHPQYGYYIDRDPLGAGGKLQRVEAFGHVDIVVANAGILRECAATELDDAQWRELLAVDGTRIKAVNNKDRNFTRASLTEFIKLADAKLDDYLQRLDRSDASESTTGGSRVKNLAEKIAAIRQRNLVGFIELMAALAA